MVAALLRAGLIDEYLHRVRPIILVDYCGVHPGFCHDLGPARFVAEPEPITTRS